MLDFCYNLNIVQRPLLLNFEMLCLFGFVHFLAVWGFVAIATSQTLSHYHTNRGGGIAVITKSQTKGNFLGMKKKHWMIIKKSRKILRANRMKMMRKLNSLEILSSWEKLLRWIFFQGLSELSPHSFQILYNILPRKCKTINKDFEKKFLRSLK